jgi:DNA-binding response OmpR family regulator
MLQARILIVDDEEIFAELLQSSLESVGYTVTVAHSGKAALDSFTAAPVDLALIDVVLPEMDGFRLCRELRARSTVPIVLLTALDNADDIMYGFSLGADDYITKPFQFREIVARIQTILQRTALLAATDQAQVVRFSGVTLDPATHTLQIGRRTFHLSPVEMRLLYRLLCQPNTLVPARELCQAVWGYSFVDDLLLLDSTVHQLRDKFALTAVTLLAIETVPGQGHRCWLAER